MDLINALAAATPSAVFVVDENLRIMAWSDKAAKGLGIPASDAVGKLCYEVVPAVDIETGRPCHEQCPLVHAEARSGWAHNRMLKAPWSEKRRTRLDCFLLRCALPTAKQANLCFIGPSTTSRMEAHSRILEAIESIFPVVTGPADIQKAAEVFLKAVVRVTSADAAELFLMDAEGREMVSIQRQGEPAQAVRGFCQSALGGEYSDLIAGSHVPMLMAGRWPDDSSPGLTGWLLSIPLVAEDRVTGVLGIASHRRDFDVATTVRVLLPVVIQISTYFRWAYLADGGKTITASSKSSNETARLRVQCLGQFRVFLDGEPVPIERFQRSKKALSLLKYLVAHRGRSVSREALMELLWPGVDPARSSGNLRVVLHALRRSLEPGAAHGSVSSLIHSRGDMVYLDPSDSVSVDAEEFIQIIRHAKDMASQGRHESALAAYRQAASLYQGDYMEDEPYSDWCLLEREYLKELYLNAVKQMAFILAEDSQVDSALDACRAALQVDPGREEIHRYLIRLLWQSGRRDEALRQYEACCRILKEELGVKPSPETAALLKAMLA